MGDLSDLISRFEMRQVLMEKELAAARAMLQGGEVPGVPGKGSVAAAEAELSKESEIAPLMRTQETQVQTVGMGAGLLGTEEKEQQRAAGSSLAGGAVAERGDVGGVEDLVSPSEVLLHPQVRAMWRDCEGYDNSARTKKRREGL